MICHETVVFEEVPKKIPDVHFFGGRVHFPSMLFFDCFATFMRKDYHREHAVCNGKIIDFDGIYRINRILISS